MNLDERVKDLYVQIVCTHADQYRVLSTATARMVEIQSDLCRDCDRAYQRITTAYKRTEDKKYERPGL